MIDNVWIKMPAVKSETEKDRVHPKYPVLTKALLVYREDKVYILVDEKHAVGQVEQHDDCHRLTPTETISFEESLPFPVSSEVFHNGPAHRKKSLLGLGDIIAWVAQKAGIEECSGCRARKRRLNKLAVWRWWRK